MRVELQDREIRIDRRERLENRIGHRVIAAERNRATSALGEIADGVGDRGPRFAVGESSTSPASPSTPSASTSMPDSLVAVRRRRAQCFANLRRRPGRAAQERRRCVVRNAEKRW